MTSLAEGAFRLFELGLQNHVLISPVVGERLCFIVENSGPPERRLPSLKFNQIKQQM